MMRLPPLFRPSYFILCGLSLCLLGCASGEPIAGADQGEMPAAADLGVRSEPLIGDVYVSVVGPDGAPIEADAVWVTVDGVSTNWGQCMELEDQAECDTWQVDYAAMERVIVWADVCGILFLDPLQLEAEPGFGRAAATRHVSIVADDVGCGGATRTPE